jgi:hypothetical protein
LSRGKKPLDKFPDIAYNIYRSKQEEDKEMKMITVKELREQLEKLEKMGLADTPLSFRDWNDVDHELTEGVYDFCETVVLG